MIRELLCLVCAADRQTSTVEEPSGSCASFVRGVVTRQSHPVCDCAQCGCPLPFGMKACAWSFWTLDTTPTIIERRWYEDYLSNASTTAQMKVW